MLDDARKLEDMGAVPGGRLESLRGDTQGRICFSWRKGAAESVEIVGYH
jgi:plasmid maintenance system killer protein